MAIPSRISRVRMLLDRISKYNDIVIADSFENAALKEIKENVRGLLRDIRDELQKILTEVDNW